jgi:hypothetical protein
MPDQQLSQRDSSNVIRPSAGERPTELADWRPYGVKEKG